MRAKSARFIPEGEELGSFADEAKRCHTQAILSPAPLEGVVMRAAFRPMTCFALFALVFTACADSPVAYSELVSIKLSDIKDKDVEGGFATEDKNINTEEGNPYGAFLSAAKGALDGVEPSRIELSEALVGLHADSEGVARLDQVFSRIELILSTSTSTYTLAESASLEGSSVELVQLDDLDWEILAPTMLQGDFKIGVRAEIVSPTPEDFEAKLFLDLRFSAFE